MRKPYYSSSKNPITILLILIVLFTAGFMLYSNHSQKNILDVYTKSDKIAAESMTEEKEELVIDTVPYVDEENHFSINIPEGWKKIENKDEVLFVHQESGSSLQIVSEEYVPTINMQNEESMSYDITQQDYTFHSFTKISTSNYEVIYQDQSTTTYDYIDEVFWNTEKIIYLKCCFNDLNYENILPYYQKIIDSFCWTKEANDLVIQDEYAVYYNPNMRIQFGVPVTWNYADTETTFSASDEETGSSLNVYSLPCTEDFKTLTGTDVANQLNDNFSYFAMNSYTNTDTSAHAVCSYNNGGNTITREAYVFVDGSYAYFLVFDYMSGMLDESFTKQCASYYRSFYTPEEENTTEIIQQENES